MTVVLRAYMLHRLWCEGIDCMPRWSHSHIITTQHEGLPLHERHTSRDCARFVARIVQHGFCG
eukprot:2405469-Prymnesium_polylepis.1